MTDFRTLDPDFYVAAQIDHDDLVAARDNGVRLVICNRPDGEDEGQPDAQTVAEWAKDLGLSFMHLPISGGRFGPETVAAMQKTLDEDVKKGEAVLAYCRSGTRSATLWALASVASGRQSTDQVIALAQTAGYDLKPLSQILHGLGSGNNSKN
ncbi:TIGR01244 family protein [Iodidimonas nitroreducens]|uniref:TIGR01244 family protein n=1 Tax=Iodidimonas nitroreducens TaxID=1236968 RepID=A0A5A7N5Q4_9PROT|nr:TIGR01244 family sulfur transferase [Iodidimonas nitroreducens]GAK33645.1 beta-lactamase hydrolase-like protein [alpha proteobacterium Q-1]GER03653.1 TIGR01244 family protein [Iodidimonas nitroreducens]